MPRPKYPVYLDNNATTPLDPAVLEVMTSMLKGQYGNPSSKSHYYGWQAADIIEDARAQVAGLIQASPDEIIFTSGTTESVNLALKGFFEGTETKNTHLITFKTVHSALLETCKALERQSVSISYLDVNEDGRIDPGHLEKAIRPETRMIALLHANNETGVIQPVKEIAALAEAKGICLFCDAAQSAGKVPIDLKKINIDLLAFSAHKMYGPKGTGALYIRKQPKNILLTPLLHGGTQEKGLRPGTLNLPAIAGFGKACAIALHKLETEGGWLTLLRNRFEKEMLLLGNVYINGAPEHRLPHVCNLSFDGLEAHMLLESLQKDLAAATGAACTSSNPGPSHVLKAMNISPDRIHGSVRFSLGRFTTAEEIDYAIDRIAKVVGRLKDQG